MAIVNQAPCYVDNVLIALGDYNYTLNSHGAFQKSFCSAHWPTNGIPELNTQLQSSSYVDGVTRYLVYDSSTM